MKLSIKGKDFSLPEAGEIKKSDWLLLLFILPALVLFLFTPVASADDLMAAGQQTVKDTFGAGSAIANWIILAEVVVGVIGYIRTKNILLLLGVAVVVVFTTIAFGLAG
jgi:type IV conjugative transfer system pilin TraA